MRLIVEGWRAIPHSYAVINQFQLLDMIQRPDLQVFHRDMPYITQDWKPVRGLFGETAEAALAAIPQPAPQQDADATLRVYCPFNFTPSTTPKTATFAATEWGIVTQVVMRAMGVQHSLREIHEDSDTIVITCSHWSKAGLVRSGAVSDRVVVIPVGVDPSLYKPLPDEERRALRKRLGWEGKFVFLCIGSDFERKGVYPLLHAFASICDRYPQAHIMLKGTEAICGSQESLHYILNQVLTPDQTAKVGDRITYIGDSLSLAQMVQLYQAADAYASPYIAEGFNIPVLEAIACGLPVLCTKGGPTDDFTHPDFALPIQSQVEVHPIRGQDRWLLRPSLEHLIFLMEQVIERQDFVARARVAGPAWVAQGYTWTHVVDRILEVLGSAVQVPLSKGDLGGSAAIALGSPLAPLEKGGTREEAPLSAVQVPLSKGDLGGSTQQTTPPSYYPLPPDLTHKRVLDLSCDRHWAEEATRRGAKEVVAIALTEAGNLGTGKRELSIHQLTPEQLGKFDVVVCFGILHQLRYPLLLLDRLAALCDGEIYLEAAILDDFSPSQGGVGRGYPGRQWVMEFCRDRGWLPTLFCLAQLVKAAGFTDVRAWKLVETPTRVETCRGFAIARRDVHPRSTPQIQ